MLDKLTHLDFQACLNQKFQIDHNDGALEVELISCTTLPSQRTHAAAREPFSIIFRGPRTPVLPQRCYPFTGGPFHGLEIFIVPVGLDEAGLRYEAIFT